MQRFGILLNLRHNRPQEIAQERAEIERNIVDRNQITAGFKSKLEAVGQQVNDRNRIPVENEITFKIGHDSSHNRRQKIGVESQIQIEIEMSFCVETDIEIKAAQLKKAQPCIASVVTIDQINLELGRDEIRVFNTISIGIHHWRICLEGEEPKRAAESRIRRKTSNGAKAQFRDWVAHTVAPVNVDKSTISFTDPDTKPKIKSKFGCYPAVEIKADAWQ